MSRNLPSWLTPTQIRAFGLRPVDVVSRPQQPQVTPGSRERQNSKNRRTRLADAGRCINGWSHGKATDGTRCRACADKRRKS